MISLFSSASHSLLSTFKNPILINNLEQLTENLNLTLQMATPFQRMFLPQQPSNPPPQELTVTTTATTSKRRRRRRPSTNDSHNEQIDIPIPYIWATSHRAKVQSLTHLIQNGIFNITGEIRCKKCGTIYQITFDLMTKFYEISSYIVRNKSSMYDRAPFIWMYPKPSKCGNCNEEQVMPVIADKKKNINWLFLLLGQMLGFCKNTHLKYFCKHTKNHRTGCKERLLYYVYLTICKQLDPSGPFDVCR